MGNEGDPEGRGLAAETNYWSTIDGMETELYVRTAPRDLHEPFTFAEGGDMGTGSDVPVFHRQTAGWDPLLGVGGGDLAQGG